MAASIRLGDIHFAAQDYRKAERAYRQARRVAPDTEPAAYALLQAGRCLNQLRRYREALRCYDAFLDTYPDSQYADDALLRAGIIHVGPLNHPDEGANRYALILERYPNSNAAPVALFHLATLAYWSRDWAAALELYRRVARTWPDHAYAAYARRAPIPELESRLKTQNRPHKGPAP